MAATVDCTIGTTWVTTMIEYECYTGGGVQVGIRPIGCVPAGTNVHLKNGQLYTDTNFVFQCMNDGTTATYTPISE